MTLKKTDNITLACCPGLGFAAGIVFQPIMYIYYYLKQAYMHCTVLSMAPMISHGMRCIYVPIHTRVQIKNSSLIRHVQKMLPINQLFNQSIANVQ